MTTTAPNASVPSAQSLQRAQEFVQLLMERYSEYHAHKESMAYGGFTVFTGAVAFALVSDAWPPNGWIYPLKDGVRPVAPPRDTDYPKVLVDAWEEAETTALTHERIIIWATWVLGVALVVRSWSCPCKLEL